ncbi:MAG: hypothetical protein ACXVCN_11830 [Bdellovibrio sp.]
MKQKNNPKAQILFFIVVFLLIHLPILGFSHSEPAISVSKPLPRSYAVFVAHYNTDNNSAVGGVAGTAFFISPSKAITAFHVLQAASFSKQPNFEKVKIWLVHEDRPAIEINLNNLKEHQEFDLTVIDFGKEKIASQPEVYPLENNLKENTSLNAWTVESDGFIANSTGPEIAKSGNDLVITSVPKLQRIQSYGRIVRSSLVHINASDVKLEHVPCFELSYKPVVGLSGGPMLKDGHVIAMNSFADPSHQSTWAVQLSQLEFLR